MQGGNPSRGPEVRIGSKVWAQPGWGIQSAPSDGWTQPMVPDSMATYTSAIFVNGTEGKPDLPCVQRCSTYISQLHSSVEFKALVCTHLEE